ncbi:hypothetical protein MTO96_000225 [Rhipicephalus appendiculatus]
MMHESHYQNPPQQNVIPHHSHAYDNLAYQEEQPKQEAEHQVYRSIAIPDLSTKHESSRWTRSHRSKTISVSSRQGEEDSAYRPLTVVLVLMAMVVSAIFGSVLTLLVSLASSSGNAPDLSTVKGATEDIPDSIGGDTPTTTTRIMPPTIPLSTITVTTTTMTTTTVTTTTVTTTTVPTTTVPTTQARVKLSFKTFTRGKFYYRSAHVDDDRGHLFVGAMDHLFKLSLDDISDQPLQVLHLPAPQKSIQNCTAFGGGKLGKDVDCRNHIREVLPIGDGSTLYVCGSNSRSPTDWQVRASDLTLVPAAERVLIDGNNETGKAEGRCSYYVSDNNPSLWLDDAPSPGVSSVVAMWRLRNGRSTIYRSAVPNVDPNKPAYSFLLTDPADTAKFNVPHAVGALSTASHAYFVYREEAAERQACGVRVASALGRVCKNDLGGDPAVRSRASRWTSFMKVRLVCTDYAKKIQTVRANFTFDEIHASDWLPDLEGGVLFGAFVTFNHGYPDSAVCAFRLEDIERAFNGTSFYELSLSRSSLSKIVKPSSAAYPGTGSACVSDSRTLPPTGPDFLASHPLLAVPPKERHERPFFAQRDVAFSGIVAFVLNEAWGSWIICYVATATGLVMKIAEEIVAGGQTPVPAELVDAFNTTVEPIRKMLVSKKYRSLYVFSDDDVRQYHIDDCEERHLECTGCVRDPFCGWEGTRCLRHVDGPASTTTRTC